LKVLLYVIYVQNSYEFLMSLLYKAKWSLFKSSFTKYELMVATNARAINIPRQTYVC
jgi:hypothetical protein